MTSFIAQGNQVASPELADPVAAAIIAFGDSITESDATTLGAHQSWPELLAERLQVDPGTAGWSVINTCISGNRLLRPGAGEAGLVRFAEDVLTRPGASWAIVLLSINDINMSIMPGMPAEQAATTNEIIAGLDQLMTQAQYHGLKIAGPTLLPTKGLFFYSAGGGAMRQAVNAWIRQSGRFDAVIDFDAATRDPADPLLLNPAFNPGDHVHPNDAGNRAMAEAIDLAIFTAKQAD